MSEYQKILGLTFCLVSGYFIIKSFLFQKKNSKPIIRKLFIYPIKTIQGVEVDHLEILDCGAKWNMFRDRCLVLVGEKNQLITLRNKPKLALISLELKDNQIILNAPGMNQLTILYDSDCSSNELVTLDIFGETCQGYVCEEYIGDWFSKFLDFKIKMVKFADGLKQSQMKVLDKSLDVNYFYQDEAPINMLNASSIGDLNRRLNGKHTVSEKNFRPNLLIDQADPFEEDHWQKIRINGVEFDAVLPCARCMMTTVNLEQGSRSENNEPLNTLKTFRLDPKWNPTAPLFGVQLVPLKRGTVYQGDPIEIVQYK